MPQNTTINVLANTWTRLTDANVTAATFRNVGEFDIWVQGTVGASAPTGGPAGIEYEPAAGETNRALADLYPGVTGVNNLYVFSRSNTSVFISNA